MNLRRTTLLALTTLTLAACGSGGSGTFNNPPSSGSYYGGVSGYYEGNASRTFIINTDRSFWILLGVQRLDRFDQIGFVSGPNIDTRDFASATLHDRYGPAGVLVNVNTSQTPVGDQFSGNIQITSNLQNSVFTGQPYALNEQPIAGDWFDLTDANGSRVNLVVGIGAFSGTDARGCTFTGQIRSTSTGGLYSLFLQDANNCFRGGPISYSGIFVTETAQPPYRQQLMIAAVGNGLGISLSGTR